MKERSGDFSDYPFPIFDPATTVCTAGGCTRQQFPGNIIPANRISAVASRVVPLIPVPDLAGFQNNYVNRSNQPANEDDYSIKIDRILTSKQQLSGAYWKSVENASINTAVDGG